MLTVQQYLKDNSFEKLTEEFGIVVKRHETLPLAILNYDQIESPKTNPCVRECRGLVLHADTYELIARSFSRFFNWGEVAEEMNDFDFSDFIVQSKEDGSLALLYHHDGQWHLNTRGSFALDKMEFHSFTWREAMCGALGISSLQDPRLNELDYSVSYVCEFCSPYNKVVRKYETPTMYLLTAFRGEHELSNEEVDSLVILSPLQWLRPKRYCFRSIEEIQSFLQEQGATDPTFEGVVIKDRCGRRWKIKNRCYLSLHRLRGEGLNLFNPKHLLPFVLSGESDELLAYFPEATEAYAECQQNVQVEYERLESVWKEHLHVDSQKDFAIAVQGRTPFTHILFRLRKELGSRQTVEDLRHMWRNSEDLILKVLAGKKQNCHGGIRS